MVVRIVVIGLGRFGKNYVKTILGLKQYDLAGICSKTSNKLHDITSQFGLKGGFSTTELTKVFSDKKIDAVVIATPASTHFKIAKQALQVKKHVLIEKPVCLSSEEVSELDALAKKQGRILMGAHIHCYNPVFERLKEDIKAKKFKKIRSINLVHVNNGPIRGDVDALWDYLPHAFSIFYNLLNEKPKSIQIIPLEIGKNKKTGLFSMTIGFPSGIIGTFFAGWSYPHKKFELFLLGDRKAALFDDLNTDAKLQYFTITNKNDYFDQKSQKITFENTMPLEKQLIHFAQCIENKKTPKTDGKHALLITQLIEAAQTSLKTGKPVLLKA